VKYTSGDHPVAGVLLPLGALHSSESAGCGEFADLPAVAHWCATVGLHVLQILPVNDTGGDSSPYSAISSCALHPIYLRIQNLPEMGALPLPRREEILARLTTLRQKTRESARFDYHHVNQEKLALLRDIYDNAGHTTDTAPFLTDNPWVPAYAVYRALKDREDQRPWMEWRAHSAGSAAVVQHLWEDSSDEELAAATGFYLWVQMRCAEQFAAAATVIDQLGVALKGDIPILMNEDSADVWHRGEIFRREVRAGAPPDMFSSLGQNWGFPVYDWQYLASEDYAWWRERLRRASQYYHAIRLDHVLGFFRIWAIPEGNSTGLLGHFWPQKGITREELYQEGFDHGRLRWLLEPHIPGEWVREADGDLQALNGPVLHQIGEEDLYNFAPDILNESALESAVDTLSANGSPVTDDVRALLFDQFRQRVLLPLPDGTFAPAWSFPVCWRYLTLTEGERDRFETLVARHESSNNTLWAAQGRELLSFIIETTDMLPCAEDLGVVPEAVPRVMGELGVLGLMIPRWSFYWDQPGQPPIPFSAYRRESVLASSVHDTSTLRGWWEQEEGRETLWEISGQPEPCPDVFNGSAALPVYQAMLKSTSQIVIFQIQDLLVLAPELLSEDPRDERINIPGTMERFNWTWRMPLTTEELMEHHPLAHTLRALLQERTPKQAQAPAKE